MMHPPFQCSFRWKEACLPEDRAHTCSNNLVCNTRKQAKGPNKSWDGEKGEILRTLPGLGHAQRNHTCVAVKTMHTCTGSVPFCCICMHMWTGSMPFCCIRMNMCTGSVPFTLDLHAHMHRQYAFCAACACTHAQAACPLCCIYMHMCIGSVPSVLHLYALMHRQCGSLCNMCKHIISIFVADSCEHLVACPHRCKVLAITRG